MKKILLTTLFTYLLLAINAQVVIPMSEIIESHNGRNYYIHTVQKGQTVYSIANVYDVTPDEIYFENPNSKQGISIAQNLLIPTINKETELKNDVVATNYDFFYHVAARNETFKHISSIYLIPEKYIIKANPNLHSPFREGEYIKVPVKEAFDILDGISQSKTNTSNYGVNKYDLNRTQGSQKSNSKTPNKKPETKKYQPQKPKSETVSFNPEIPVIKDYRHVVILGETTKSIAAKYSIDIALLKSANHGLGNSVTKGDRLRIPDKTKLQSTTEKPSNASKKPVIIDSTVEVKTTKTTPSPAETEPETIKHKVKKKETLYSIGREYGVTVTQILDANKGLTPTIKTGQIIIVPKKKISKPYIIHKVDRDTKTSKLAKLYRIPIYQIVEFNPTIGKRIYKNEEVKIPVGKHAIIAPLIPEEDTFIVIPDQSSKPINIDITSNNCDYSPDTNRIFKIALLVPLSLEEADSLNIEQFLLSHQKHFIPFRFIQFYEGALIALDSISKQGMKVEMYVYDVDKNLAKTAKVLQKRELRTMNLIIGPFYNNSFNQVALFAGNFNIPIVNPLSYREAVVNNYSTVIKIKPSNISQVPLIESYIDRFANGSKVFLISQTSYIDADNVIEVSNGIKSTLEPQIKISNQNLFDLSFAVAQRDTLFDITTTPPQYIFEGTNIYPEILENTISDSTLINNNLIRINYATDSLYPFLENASPLRNNLVVLYGTKKSFVLDVLNRLNESRDTFDIQLIGMPTWERISNLNNVKMNNLNLSYFSSNYIDYDDENTQNFIYKFRNTYQSEPDEFAYSGFDITYYFLNSLFNLGDNFNKCLEHYPMKMTKTKFHFEKVSSTNNFENNYWNLLKMNNMSIYKIPDEIILPKQQNNQYE